MSMKKLCKVIIKLETQLNYAISQVSELGDVKEDLERANRELNKKDVTIIDLKNQIEILNGMLDK